jgi:hypothetical protein
MAARDRSGQLRGLVPLAVQRQGYWIGLKGRKGFEIPRRFLCVVGGTPSLLADPCLFDGFVEAVDNAFPSCAGLAIRFLLPGSPLFRYLLESRAVWARFISREWDASQDSHRVLPLPQTFDEYLDKFTHKRRYNLTRQVRVLQKHLGDSWRFETLRTVEALGRLHQHAAASAGDDATGVSFLPSDWRRFSDLAQRDLLLGFVLCSGGTPVACMLGLSYGSTYLVDSIRHHASFNRFSPGAVLLHLVVEALIATGAARLMNFQSGCPAYRYSATQSEEEYAGVFLLRKTIENQVMLVGERAFKDAKALLKCLFRADTRPTSLIPDAEGSDEACRPQAVGDLKAIAAGVQ